MRDKKSFNKQGVFDAEVLPLLNQVFALCKKHDIPIVSLATFFVEDTPTVTQYGQSVLVHGWSDMMHPVQAAVATLYELPRQIGCDLADQVTECAKRILMEQQAKSN